MAWTLIEGSDGQWLTITDGSQLREAVDSLRATAPQGPTSLHAAFAAMRPLDPKPDNIYLLADGLPTMGEITPARAGVTGRERQGHFNRAVRELPFNVPVNVILYALEGDPQALLRLPFLSEWSPTFFQWHRLFSSAIKYYCAEGASCSCTWIFERLVCTDLCDF